MSGIQKESFAKVMGIIFIILGVVGFLVLVISFDYKEYNELKVTSLDGVQLDAAKSELFYRWVIGIATLIINLAIGSLLFALDKIIKLLEDIKEASAK